MNPLKSFLNNLSSQSKTTPFNPFKTSSTNTPAPVQGPKPVVSSNVGATPTTPTKIIPPKTTPSNPLTIKLPPSGQQFVQNQTNSAPNGYYSQSSYDGNPVPLPNPTTAVNPPAPQQSATDSAFAEYIKSLQPSTDVTNAKTAYNDYVANQKTSISGLEGQGRGIPLTLVRGQQEKLLNQTQPEATRLQNNIGIAQDSAKSISDANLAKYNYETGKETKAKTAITDTKPFDVGDHTYVFNPVTQKYEDKGLNTKDTTTGSNAGFTLSPGEIRYDANGKQIASGGPRLPTQAQETAQLAKTEKENAAQESASQSIGIINGLLTGDRYKSISGGIQGGSVPFFGDRAAKNEYDQLQGLLKLGKRSLLKGQGAVSDYEGKILGQAASSLDRGTSEDQFREALQKVRGVLKTNNGQTTTVDVTNPKTGETIKDADLSGAEIYHLVSEGNTIKYK